MRPTVETCSNLKTKHRASRGRFTLAGPRTISALMIMLAAVSAGGCGGAPSPVSIATDLFGDGQYDQAIRYIDQQLQDATALTRDDRAALLLLKGQSFYNQSDVAFQANNKSRQTKLLEDAYKTLSIIIDDKELPMTHVSVSGAYYIRSRVLESLGRTDEADRDHLAYRNADPSFRQSNPANDLTNPVANRGPEAAETEPVEEPNVRPRSTETAETPDPYQPADPTDPLQPRRTPNDAKRNTYAEQVRDRLNRPGQLGARSRGPDSSPEATTDRTTGKPEDDIREEGLATKEPIDEPEPLTEKPYTRVPSSTFTLDGVPPLGIRPNSPTTGLGLGAVGSLPSTGLGTNPGAGRSAFTDTIATGATGLGTASTSTGRISPQSNPAWNNTPVDPSNPTTGLSGPAGFVPTGAPFAGVPGASGTGTARPNNPAGLGPNLPQPGFAHRNLPTVGGVGTTLPGMSPGQLPGGGFANPNFGSPSGPLRPTGGIGNTGTWPNSAGTGNAAQRPAASMSFGAALPKGFAPKGPQPQPQF